jgi:glycosyltransferase involved in cell wall biosynthesis
MHVRRAGNRKTYLSQSEFIRTVAHTTLRMLWKTVQLPTDAYQICKAQPINGLVAVMAHVLRWKPLYLDSDDYEAEFNRFTKSWQHFIVRKFEQVLPRLAQGVTTHTRFNVERHLGYGVSPERLFYVPNGVDRDRFEKVSDQAVRALRERLDLIGCSVVLYVGNLSLTNHPIDLLLEAFAEVHRGNADARLLLVGGGEDYDTVKARVARMGLADVVLLAGRVVPERVPVYLKLADVSVEPVLDDEVARARSPLKVFESMAVGTPVVAGDVGDRNEILGEAGLLVPPADENALAQGLLAVLRDPALRQHMIEAALIRRERYYWDVLVNDFEKIYAV